MDATNSLLEDFRREALELCTHLETHDRLRRGKFLRQLAARLGALYVAALSLPEVSPDSDELLPDVVTKERQLVLREGITEKFGTFHVYWEVFDPFDTDDVKPVAGDIAGELVETYCDLQKVIVALDTVASTRPNDVLWSARFDFVHHWSRHVTSSLKAVDALLNMHYVEALESEEADL